jgi:hypothetical protein
VRVAVLSTLLRRGDDPALAAVALLAEEAQRADLVDLFLAALADVFRSAGADSSRLRALLNAGPAWLPLSTPASRAALAGAIGVEALRRAANAAATPPTARPVAQALLEAHRAAGPHASAGRRPRREDSVIAVARAALTRAAVDPDPRVRARARQVLRQLPPEENGENVEDLETPGAEPTEATVVDLDAAADPEAGADRAAARVLARQLVDPDPTVRRLAVDALARFPGGEGLPAVVAALRDDDTAVRATARRHLAARWSPEVERLVGAADPQGVRSAGGARPFLDQLDEGAEGTFGVDEGHGRTP